MLYQRGDDPKMSVSAERQQCAHVSERSSIRHCVRLMYKVPSLLVIFSPTSVQILMGRWDKQVDSMSDLLNKWWLLQGSGLSACLVFQLPCSYFLFCWFFFCLFVCLWTNYQNSVWADGLWWRQILEMLNWLVVLGFTWATNGGDKLYPSAESSQTGGINCTH